MLNEQQESQEQRPPSLVANEPKEQETLYSVLGIDLEGLRQTLKDAHDISLSKDDPILMMVTIFNVCLEKQEAIFQKHQQAITEYLGKTTDKYTGDITKAIGELNYTFKQIASDTITGMFAEHAQMLGRFKQSLWWPVSVAITSALINIAVLLLLRFANA